MIALRSSSTSKKSGSIVQQIGHVIIHPDVERVRNGYNDYVCKCCGERFTQQINGFIVSDAFENAKEAIDSYAKDGFEVYQCKVL